MRLRVLAFLTAFTCMAMPALAVEIQEEEAVQEPESDEWPAQTDPALMPQPTEAARPAVITPPSAAPTGPEPSDKGDMNFDTVRLQGLNKVTARAQELEAPIGSVIRYGTIEIIAHKCWKSSPDRSPENAALLEVSEIKQGEKPQNIFWGWMFSSTPALSSLEHPFYDISVVGCSKSTTKQ